MRIKNMVAILLMLGLTVALFAYGQGEENGKMYGQRQDHEKSNEEFRNLIESKEKISLTGELSIKNRVLPELKVGNEVYKLMVPRFCMVNLEVDEGTEVLLEGVILKVKKDVNIRILNEGDKVFLVTKAIINGEEYNPEEESEECTGPHNSMGRKGFNRKGHHGQGGHDPGFNGPMSDIFE